MAVEFESVFVCEDCFTVIGSEDLTSFDYWYSPDESARRVEKVTKAVASMPGYLYAGDPDEDIEFSCTPCECCGNSEAGAHRHCLMERTGK